MSFKIIRKNCCGLDVHKTWIFACIGITDSNGRSVHTCLTVSNLKLDDVFSDIFGKSSRSITEQILQHPGDFFDVKPFVDRRCKTPSEEIQAAVDGAISPEQALNLMRQRGYIIKDDVAPAIN